MQGRRTFIRQMAASTALLTVAGCTSTAGSVGDSSAAGFRHGVASGDPLSDRVILWTRITPARAGRGGSALAAGHRSGHAAGDRAAAW
jgi:alkaline phosphatase D